MNVDSNESNSGATINLCQLTAKISQIEELMKQTYTILSLALIILLAFAACSEDKSPLASTAHHDSDWNTLGAENSHGAKVLEIGYVSCESCHGADLKGGDSMVGCFDCHQTYPHPPEWNLITDANFHGKFILNNSGSTTYCQGCHGTNLAGGKSGVSCYSCHPAGSL